MDIFRGVTQKDVKGNRNTFPPGLFHVVSTGVLVYACSAVPVHEDRVEPLTVPRSC